MFFFQIIELRPISPKHFFCVQNCLICAQSLHFLAFFFESSTFFIISTNLIFPSLPFTEMNPFLHCNPSGFYASMISPCQPPQRLMDSARCKFDIHHSQYRPSQNSHHDAIGSQGTGNREPTSEGSHARMVVGFMVVLCVFPPPPPPAPFFEAQIPSYGP